MARRLNTKLVVFLSAGLLGLGVALAAVWYVAGRRSAAATLREADKAMAAGKYLDATKLYAKVAGYREYSEDLDVMIHASEANSLTPVTSVRDASHHLGTQIAWLERAVHLHPHDPRPLQLLMDLRVRLAVEMGRSSEWDSVHDKTQAILESYPDFDLAIKYRAISQVYRIADASAIKPTAADRQQITDILRAAQSSEENSQDSRYAKHLARWNLLEADSLDELGGDRELAAELRNEAVQLTRAALEKNPEDLDRLLDHMFILLSLDRLQKSAPYVEQLRERLLKEPASPQLTSRAIQLILQHYVKATKSTKQDRLPSQYLEQCEQIARAAREAYPNSLLMAFTLGNVLRDQNKFEGALIMFDNAWNTSDEAPPMDFLRRRIYRMVCGISSLEIWSSRVEPITDQVERKKILGDMEAKLKVIIGEFGERPALTKLAGRISYARGDYIEAAIHVDESLERGEDSMRTLLESAELRMRMKEWGAATDQFKLVVKRWPHVTPARYALAQLYVRQKMYAEADKQLESIPERAREGEKHQRMKVEILLGQEKFDEVDELLSEMHIADNPMFSIRAAQQYFVANRKDTAIQILEDAFNEQPGDTYLLIKLMEISTDKEKQLTYVEQGEKAGVDAEWVERLRKLIRGELDVESEVESVLKERIASQEDPALRAVQWYAYYQREGDIERAREELRKVSDDELHNPLVIDAMFVDALSRRDFKEAGLIVARARTAKDGKGADLAKGAFFLARLKIAQGLNDEAVAALREGLEFRQVYSHGWVTLGFTLLRTQEYGSASEAFQTALKQRPTNARGLIGLSLALYHVGNNKGALKSLRSLYEYHSRNYMHANRYLQYEEAFGSAERALQLRQDIAERAPGNVHNLLAMARTLSKLKRHDEAIEQIDEVIDKRGLTLDSVITKAAILRNAGEIEDATDELQDFIQSSDKDPEGRDYHIVAQQLSVMGQTNFAISAYRQASRIEGKHQRPATTELAQLLIQRADGVDEAIQIYKDILESNPDDVQARVTYTRALLQNEKIDDAEQIIRATAAEHGHTVTTLMLEGQIAQMRGRTDEAVSRLDAAIEKQPRNATLYMVKAELLSKNPEHLGNALSVLDRALELDPLLDDARQLRAVIQRSRGDLSAAISELEKILQRNPKRPVTRKELAALYSRTRDFQKLDNLLSDSGKLYPDDAYWPRHEALRASEMNKLSVAIQKMKIAFEVDESSENLSGLVSMLLAAQKPDVAMQHLDDNAAMLADSPELTVLRGQAILKTQGRSEAVPMFRQALKKTEKHGSFQYVRNEIVESLGPATTRDLVVSAFGDSPPVPVLMGIADLEMKSGEFESMVTRLRPLAAKIDEQSREVQRWFHRLYAIALHQTGRYAEAAKAYRNQLKINPRNIVARNNLAYLLADNLEKPEEAVEIMEAAIKHRPNAPELLDTMGFALHKIGQNERAAHVLEHSINIKPQVTTILHLVDVMLAIDNTERATELLQQAKELAQQTDDLETLKRVNERLQALGQ